MSIAFYDTVKALESAMQSLGEFDAVIVGEPKNAPQNRTLSIFAADADSGDMNLSTPQEIRALTFRYYVRAFEDEEDAEYDSIRMYDLVRQVLAEDLDLSDFGGAETGVIEVEQAGINATWGYITIDSTVYRTVDIRVPVWADGAATFAR